MKNVSKKFFDGAKWWQVVLLSCMMAAPFIAIMAKL